MNRQNFDQRRGGAGRYAVAAAIGGAVLVASGAAAWPVLKSVVGSDVATAVTAPDAAPGADEAQLLRVSAFVADTELSSDVAAISTMSVPSALTDPNGLNDEQHGVEPEMTFVPDAPESQREDDSPLVQPVLPRTAQDAGHHEGSSDRMPPDPRFTPRSLVSAPAQQSPMVGDADQQVSMRDEAPLGRSWSVGQFR